MMVERICPQCQYGNSLENRFCARCGTNLEHPHLPARHVHEGDLMLAGSQLPAQWKQVGKAMAMSLAALAAEAGMTWLRRRVERMKATPPTLQAPPAQQSLSVPQMTRPALPTHAPARPDEKVTIFSQRIVETWEHGTLTRQTIERTIWRREREG